MGRQKGATFQPRDGEILEAIYAYGVVAQYQLQQQFFGNSLRTAQIRLKKLEDLGFIAKPDRQQRAQLPYAVHWLTRKGAEYIANLYNVSVDELAWQKPGERWHETIHDLDITDFRLRVKQACGQHPELKLTEWIGSKEFWKDHDFVEYSILTDARKHRRGVRPDSYFVIEQQGQPPSRFLLEIDRSTETHARIAREKLHAGVAYIKSAAYKARFGFNAGRWLVAIGGGKERARHYERMRHMQERTVRELGRAASVFYFTTQELTQTHNVLTDAIWYRGGEKQPTALFESYLRNATHST